MVVLSLPRRDGSYLPRPRGLGRSAAAATKQLAGKCPSPHPLSNGITVADKVSYSSRTLKVPWRWAVQRLSIPADQLHFLQDTANRTHLQEHGAESSPQGIR